jgi:hypothetical protein
MKELDSVYVKALDWVNSMAGVTAALASMVSKIV